MNRATITRKFFLLARRLSLAVAEQHRRSLDRVYGKAIAEHADAYLHTRQVEAALVLAREEEQAARHNIGIVDKAIRAERRELGI